MELEFTKFNDIYDGTLKLDVTYEDGYTMFRYKVKPGEQLLYTTISDIVIEVWELRQGRIYDHFDPLEIRDDKGKCYYFNSPITEGHFTLIRSKKIMRGNK